MPVFCVLVVSAFATIIFLLTSGIKSSPQEGRKVIIKLFELKSCALVSILKLTRVNSSFHFINSLHRMQGEKAISIYVVRTNWILPG